MADPSIRRDEYEDTPLGADDIGADPIAAIGRWVQEAWDAGEPQANAMCLATVGADGLPSARTVLLKGLDEGLLFFTNYESAKGEDLAATNYAAANFTWLLMHRQIRASGPVGRVSPAESDEYFASRPRGAQIAASASRQSAPLLTREALEGAFAEVAERYTGPVPRPEHWGGYRLIPQRIEFWAGRRSRLHDRIEYSRSAAGWSVQRLSP